MSIIYLYGNRKKKFLKQRQRQHEIFKTEMEMAQKQRQRQTSFTLLFNTDFSKTLSLTQETSNSLHFHLCLSSWHADRQKWHADIVFQVQNC